MTRFLSVLLLGSLVPVAGTTAKAADLDYDRTSAYERPVIEERRVVEERRIIEERPVVVERPIERRVYVEPPIIVERPLYPRPYVRVLRRYPRPYAYAGRYPYDDGFRRFGYGFGPYGY